MIVVDSNVVAYLYLPGDHTPKVEALLERDPAWVAPLLWRSEFRNILVDYLRREMLSPESARNLQLEAERLMAGAEHEVGSGLVLELAQRSACSAYDCEYVALAMALGVKLVTMDRQVLRTFPECAVGLGEV